LILTAGGCPEMKRLYSFSYLIQSKVLYHGTPGKVGDAGEFSTDFINTGEGLQAYGWGLYFAENKKVAEGSYHKRLADFSGHVYLEGKELKRPSDKKHDPLSKALRWILDYVVRGKNREPRITGLLTNLEEVLEKFRTGVFSESNVKAWEYLRVGSQSVHSWHDWLFQGGRSVPEMIKYIQEIYNILFDWFQSGKYMMVTYDAPKIRGHTYEVDLKVSDDYFLVEDWLWDKQPQTVKNRLLKAKTPVVKAAVAQWMKRHTWKGENFLVYLYQQMGGTGSAFSNRAIAKKESLDLRATGIHGYKFLDGFSRGKAHGTFNYIIIDDKDVETVQHVVKDEKTGQVDLFTQEQYVVPSKRTSASLKRLIRSGLVSEEVSLTSLADLINATQSDLHYLHFYAGSEGFWDRIHDICGDYYVRLAEDYDDIAELCLQLDMDVTHPNNSASVLGFENSAGSLENLFSYESVMQIVQDRLHNILDYAVGVLRQYQGESVNATAVRNYLEGFVQEWSKEVDYKTKERLGGDRDFGGAYRDTAGEQMITGDVVEEGFDGITSSYNDEDVVDEDGPFTVIAKGFNSAAKYRVSFDTFAEASKYLRDHGDRFDYAEVVDGRGHPLLFENYLMQSSELVGHGGVEKPVIDSSKEFYSDLLSEVSCAIFSMAKIPLQKLSRARLVWLQDFSKELLKGFPSGTYGCSDEDVAWQIFNGDGDLLLSVGLVESSGETIYVYYADGERKTGRTRDVADLKALIPVISGGR
jgi:hypothetical protein